MKIIGITGGVGAGKSTVLEYIQREFDAFVMQADQVGHLLMRPGESCYEPMIRLFGKGILKEDGTIDRQRVGKIVFSNDRMLKKLNAIVHPRVKSYILNEISRQERMGTKLFVMEAALLLEDEYDALCDEVWYIYADEKVRRQRLSKERGYSDEKIDGILANQMTEQEFERRCDYKIENNGNLEVTYRQIQERIRYI
ncbi:MAG: dephospho-CoA kinase [Blautia sp.]|jgi:dephospho-CoA kinase